MSLLNWVYLVFPPQLIYFVSVSTLLIVTKCVKDPGIGTQETYARYYLLLLLPRAVSCFSSLSWGFIVFVGAQVKYNPPDLAVRNSDLNVLNEGPLHTFKPKLATNLLRPSKMALTIFCVLFSICLVLFLKKYLFLFMFSCVQSSCGTIGSHSRTFYVSCGLFAVCAGFPLAACGLSSCSMRLSFLVGCGILLLTRDWTQFLALKGRFLTTWPTGQKSFVFLFFDYIVFPWPYLLSIELLNQVLMSGFFSCCVFPWHLVFGYGNSVVQQRDGFLHLDCHGLKPDLSLSNSVVWSWACHLTLSLPQFILLGPELADILSKGPDRKN